jgi:hypothetical protein
MGVRVTRLVRINLSPLAVAGQQHPQQSVLCCRAHPLCAARLPAQLRKDCQDIGRERRRHLLQQHRSSMSPCELQVR